MIEQPLEIGLNSPGFGSLFTALYSGAKGPKGQPPGTTWLTFGQIDAQVARQIKATIEAQCLTAPMAVMTAAAKKSLTDLSAYLDVLSDSNTVSQVVADATHALSAAGQLVPLAACGGLSVTPTPTPTPTPVGTTPAGTAGAISLSSPSGLLLFGGVGLGLLMLLRRK